MPRLLLIAIGVCGGLNLLLAVVSAPLPLNLVIVTLDTFRADRLGVYGSTRGLTPNLDRFAADGVTFGATESAAPLTLPAHCSLFTARFPSHHGVHQNGDALRAAGGPTTLAEALASGGFQTAAFVAAQVLEPTRGLNRGFSHYDTGLNRLDAYGRAVNRRTAPEVLARAVHWIDDRRGARFFAWLHFYDAHAPYDAPGEYRPPGRDRYDSAVAFVDAQIGRLLTFLESRGLLERTVVVVVGDHGESLGDHGESTHGLFLYEGVLHVPLMIRAPDPRVRGRRVNGVTRSVDVLPTVLDLLRLPSVDGIDGETLLPFDNSTRRDADAYAENLYPHLQFGWSRLHSLRSGQLKLVATARPELYDLGRDPQERNNLFTTRPAMARQLLQRLNRYRGAGSDANPGDARRLDRREQERLASLGYVSSGRSLADEEISDEAGADPKDQVVLFNRLSSPRIGRGLE